MSLLAPIFLAGLSALAVPLVLHLIRRTSKETIEFSSTLFVDPADPPVTRRRQLDGPLLLLIRLLAITMLVLAFCRPFFESFTPLDNQPSRLSVLVIDQSASMRREGILEQVQEVVRQVRDGLIEDRNLLVYGFDETLKSYRVSADLADGQTPARADLDSAMDEAAQPGWRSGNLLDASQQIIEEVKRLQVERENEEVDIHFVSDLQTEASWSQFQQLPWPDRSSVHWHATRPTPAGNASVIRIPPRENESLSADAERIRVVNSADSNVLRFEVGFFKGDQWVGEREGVEVLPGRSRTIRLKLPQTTRQPNTDDVSELGEQQREEGNEELGIVPDEGFSAVDGVRLIGDEHEFDNRFFFIRPSVEPERVVILTKGKRDNAPEESSFFLKKLPVFVRGLQVDFEEWSTLAKGDPVESLKMLISQKTPLAIVGDLESVLDLSEPDLKALKATVELGGHLVVLMGSGADAKAIETFNEQLGLNIGIPDIEARSIEPRRLTRIDFGHPAMKQLSEPPYNNFSNIHVWRLTPLKLDDDWTTLAATDDGLPVLSSCEYENGRLTISSMNWVPSDSDFVLSSKFVPVVTGLLRPTSTGSERGSYTLGDRILENLSQAIDEPGLYDRTLAEQDQRKDLGER
ncbi:MAG: BatA domain-containing protein, partial [Planctomycetota bacterium]